MNKKICGFTGHRPQSLPWGYNENCAEFYKFKNNLTNIIKNSINKGYTFFISGMALGVDMIAAKTIIELKSEYP